MVYMLVVVNKSGKRDKSNNQSRNKTDGITRWGGERQVSCLVSHTLGLISDPLVDSIRCSVLVLKVHTLNIALKDFIVS